jgi:large subunit ribosomal protein L25
MAGERVKLQVKERERRGSADARRLRREGLIPGVLYGSGKQPHAICIPERELRRVLTGRAACMRSSTSSWKDRRRRTPRS